MSERIRFHLDEQVKSAIAHELRRRGIDVTTTFEAGLRTRSDEAQLTFIRQEQRVIFTHDEDFLIIASYTRTPRNRLLQAGNSFNWTDCRKSDSNLRSVLSGRDDWSC